LSETVLDIKAFTRRFGAFTAVDALTLSVNADKDNHEYSNSLHSRPFRRGGCAQPHCDVSTYADARRAGQGTHGVDG